jgi:hypothetical protein
MESLEEILITSDGEEEQEQEQTFVQLAEPRATSPSSCNGPSSSSPLPEMSSLPAEPVFQCPLDSCNFIIAQEVGPCTKILLYLSQRYINSPGPLHSIFFINENGLCISVVDPDTDPYLCFWASWIRIS